MRNLKRLMALVLAATIMCSCGANVAFATGTYNGTSQAGARPDGTVPNGWTYGDYRGHLRTILRVRLYFFRGGVEEYIRVLNSEGAEAAKEYRTVFGGCDVSSEYTKAELQGYGVDEWHTASALDYTEGTKQTSGAAMRFDELTAFEYLTAEIGPLQGFVEWSDIVAEGQANGWNVSSTLPEYMGAYEGKLSDFWSSNDETDEMSDNLRALVAHIVEAGDIAREGGEKFVSQTGTYNVGKWNGIPGECRLVVEPVALTRINGSYVPMSLRDMIAYDYLNGHVGRWDKGSFKYAWHRSANNLAHGIYCADWDEFRTTMNEDRTFLEVDPYMWQAGTSNESWGKVGDDQRPYMWELEENVNIWSTGYGVGVVSPRITEREETERDNSYVGRVNLYLPYGGGTKVGSEYYTYLGSRRDLTNKLSAKAGAPGFLEAYFQGQRLEAAKQGLGDFTIKCNNIGGLGLSSYKWSESSNTNFLKLAWAGSAEATVSSIGASGKFNKTEVRAVDSLTDGMTYTPLMDLTVNMNVGNKMTSGKELPMQSSKDGLFEFMANGMADTLESAVQVDGSLEKAIIAEIAAGQTAGMGGLAGTAQMQGYAEQALALAKYLVNNYGMSKAMEMFEPEATKITGAGNVDNKYPVSALDNMSLVKVMQMYPASFVEAVRGKVTADNMELYDLCSYYYYHYQPAEIGANALKCFVTEVCLGSLSIGSDGRCNVANSIALAHASGVRHSKNIFTGSIGEYVTWLENNFDVVDQYRIMNTVIPSGTLADTVIGYGATSVATVSDVKDKAEDLELRNVADGRALVDIVRAQMHSMLTSEKQDYIANYMQARPNGATRGLTDSAHGFGQDALNSYGAYINWAVLSGSREARADFNLNAAQKKANGSTPASMGTSTNGKANTTPEFEALVSLATMNQLGADAVSDGDTTVTVVENGDTGVQTYEMKGNVQMSVGVYSPAIYGDTVLVKEKTNPDGSKGYEVAGVIVNDFKVPVGALTSGAQLLNDDYLTQAVFNGYGADGSFKPIVGILGGYSKHGTGDSTSTEGLMKYLVDNKEGIQNKTAEPLLRVGGAGVDNTVINGYKPGDMVAYGTSPTEANAAGTQNKLNDGNRMGYPANTATGKTYVDNYMASVADGRFKQFVLAEINAPGGVKIITVHTDENDNDTVTGPYDVNVPDNKRIPAPTPGPGESIQEWIVTPDEPVQITKWEDVPGGDTGNTSEIPVDDNTKTVYVHYVKTPTVVASGAAVLSESRLAESTNLGSIISTGLTPNEISTNEHWHYYCSGHTHSGTDPCDCSLGEGESCSADHSWTCKYYCDTDGGISCHDETHDSAIYSKDGFGAGCEICNVDYKDFYMYRNNNYGGIVCTTCKHKGETWTDDQIRYCSDPLNEVCAKFDYWHDASGSLNLGAELVEDPYDSDILRLRYPYYGAPTFRKSNPNVVVSHDGWYARYYLVYRSSTPRSNVCDCGYDHQHIGVADEIRLDSDQYCGCDTCYTKFIKATHDVDYYIGWAGGSMSKIVAAHEGTQSFQPLYSYDGELTNGGRGYNERPEAYAERDYWKSVTVDMIFDKFRGEDKPTICQYNNGGVDPNHLNSLTGTMGMATGVGPSATRAAAGSYTGTVTTTISDDPTGHDYTLGYEHPSCKGTGEIADGWTSIDVSDAGYSYDITVNVFRDPTAGVGNATAANGVAKTNSAGKIKVIADEFTNAVGTAANSSETTSTVIKWYPYYRMFYGTPNDSDQLKPINMVADNVSTIWPVDYVEVGYKTASTGPTLNIDSAQWSTHQRATGTWGTNNVLPGGALYQLSVASGAETEVGASVWFTFLDGADVTAGKFVDGTAEYTFDNQKNKAEQFITTMKQAIESYDIVEMLEDNKSTGANPAMNGKEIEMRGGQMLFDGNLSSNDAKYWLRRNTSNGITNDTKSNRADLDVLNTVQAQTYYGIWSDVEGNVYVGKSNTVAGVKGNIIGQITKNQGAAALLTQGAGQIKDLDDRTKLVTNFLNAIDRNKGNDQTLADRKWYNEACDGIYVCKYDTILTIGFGGSNPKRTAAIDPKQEAPRANQAGILSDANAAAFRTSVAPTIQSGTAGFMGAYKGKTVTVDNAQFMYKTKTFWIPNISVTDLY